MAWLQLDTHLLHYDHKNINTYVRFFSQQVELAKTNFGIRDLNTGVGLHNITAELYREASKNNEIMEWDLIGTA